MFSEIGALCAMAVTAAEAQRAVVIQILVLILSVFYWSHGILQELQDSWSTLVEREVHGERSAGDGYSHSFLAWPPPTPFPQPLCILKRKNKKKQNAP